MIKAIIFDCFGVLTKDWWRAFCDELPKGPIKDKASLLNHQYDAGVIKLNEMVDELEKLTGHSSQSIEEIFTRPESVKNHQLLAYIKELKKDYKIGMISNIGTDWVRQVFLTKQEQKLFDAMVFSFEVGTTKPNHKMYEICLDKLSVSAQESIFIDDQQQYVEAAQTLGIKGIWFKDFPQMKKELEALLTGSKN
jgi:HAD superfamily hydrolase (TIGR01509 family)